MGPSERFELSSPGYEPGILAAELTGNGSGGGARSPIVNFTKVALSLLSYARICWSGRSELNTRSQSGTLGPNRSATSADKQIGADGDNWNLFSGLEAQGTPYIPRPLKIRAIQLSMSNGAMVGDLGIAPSPHAPRAWMLLSHPSPTKTKKAEVLWEPRPFQNALDTPKPGFTDHRVASVRDRPTLWSLCFSRIESFVSSQPFANEPWNQRNTTTPGCQ